MVLKLTNLIKSLFLKLENNTFVTALGNKCVQFKKSLDPQIEASNERIFFFLCKTKAKAKRSYKYVLGKIRMRRFIEWSITEYDNEYTKMTVIVDSSELKTDPEKSKAKYDLCKNNIGIILRANKRINTKRMVNKVQIFSCINTRIHLTRTKKKYTLANYN